MGVNEVHYAMVAVFAMGFGLFTPPFGVGFYLACAIGRVSPDVAISMAWPHLAALVVALLLITLIPWISIRLPGQSRRARHRSGSATLSASSNRAATSRPPPPGPPIRSLPIS